MSSSGYAGAPGHAMPPSAPRRGAQLLANLAVVGLIASIIVLVAASIIRPDWMFPHLSTPASGPPWQLSGARVSPGAVTIALWLAALAGGGGVAGGLLAVRRGAHISVRLLLILGAVAVAALTVLPPVGSSDALDYAAYGRIADLGRDPYLVAPHFLRAMHGAFARAVPRIWQHQVSVYGPFATAEQYLAARLGGTSIARVVFWLKLPNALAYGAIALVIDRLTRSEPALRLRAHLLWTVNPLLLWVIVAAGHLDVLAAAAGLIALALVGRPAAAGPHDDIATPALWRIAAAGALIGLAAGIKINYAVYGLGLAWLLRRSWRAVAVATAGATAVLVPAYLWAGYPAIRAILNRRSTTSADDFYRLLVDYHLHLLHYATPIAAVIVVIVAILALRGLPDGFGRWPAIRPAIALSAAWLFFWPYQMPWYDAMIVCLIVLYPESRLDWLVLVRLTAGTVASIPGNPWRPASHLVASIDYSLIGRLAPVALLAAAVGLVALCLTGRWNAAGRGFGQAMSPDAAPLSASATPVSRPRPARLVAASRRSRETGRPRPAPGRWRSRRPASRPGPRRRPTRCPR